MSQKKIEGTILNRRDTKANWNSKNPVLEDGEIGIISDDNDLKLGDGSSDYKSLKSIKEDVKSILDLNSQNGISFWSGTQEEYSALQDSLSNTLCIIV